MDTNNPRDCQNWMRFIPSMFSGLSMVEIGPEMSQKQAWDEKDETPGLLEFNPSDRILLYFTIFYYGVKSGIERILPGFLGRDI